MRGKGRHATRDTSQGAFVPASRGGPGAYALAFGGLAPCACARLAPLSLAALSLARSGEGVREPLVDL